MLNLAAPTEPGWVERALADLDQVLIDHAHCEKKAASSALSMLFRYPEQAALLAPLSQLAREELTHFEEVVGHLAARGIGLAHQVPSPYAAGLMATVRPDEPGRLVDTLLCMGLIEARSCERLRLLAESVPDAELAAFFRGLLASEARHHQTYLDLAATVVPAADVRTRLRDLARHEADVLARVPPVARIHG